LYDAAGSALFEKITALPEYYPTRTETEILRDRACEIACETPAGSVLIEFGSGSSLKTELLLAEMRDLYAYIPIDISDAALRGAQARIEERFPDLRVLPLRGDFAQPIPMPPDVVGRPRLGFFPGSTIGNLENPIAIKLLANMAQMLGENGRLVIGADLKKDERQLVSAYDDAAGVTAAFNLNLLKRANRELGADFDVGQFDHLAEYDSNRDRIEIFLVSQAEQTVEVLGRRFRFAAGERVHTEHSHKYDIEGFHALAARAGWRPVHVWTDEDRLFSVHTLETV
jgi:dimethylhistidine N-methyltransferase